MSAKKGDKKDKNVTKDPNSDKMFEIDTISPDIKKLLTAKHLLYSFEDMVVYKAVLAIDQYISKPNEIKLNFMVEQDFTSALIKLIPRHKTISRFALKILATLVQVPIVRQILIFDVDCIEILTNAFLDTTDEIIQEYVTHLLNVIAPSETICNIMLRREVVEKLVNTTAVSENPDIKRNCLQVIHHITQCSSGHEFVDYLSPEIYICLLQNPLPEIKKCALHILCSLATWNNEGLREKLRDNNLIQMLFLELMTNDWNDDHNLALSIITYSITNPEFGKAEIESLEFLKLLQYTNNEDVSDAVVLAVVSIVAEYAKDEFCRTVLFNYKAYDLLLKFFDYDCDMIKIKLCETFSYLVLNTCITERVFNKNLLLPLTRIMNQDQLPWNPYKEAAIKTIYNLSFANNLLPLLLYRCNTLKPLQKAIESRNEISKSHFLYVIEIFEMLFLNHAIRDYILNEQIYPNLIMLMLDVETRISVIAINVIQDSIRVQKYREWFRLNNGLEVIMTILREQPNELADQITTLLEECSRYKCLGKELLHLDVCKYLTKLPKYHIEPKRCRNLIQNFYSHDLSMKFYDLNLLNICDVTKNGFFIYAHRKPPTHDLSSFPVKLSPNDTIITVNFTPVPPELLPLDLKDKNGEYVYEISPPDPPATVAYDFYLYKCYKKISTQIKECCSIEEKIRFLAKFVARQLSGSASKKLDVPRDIDCKMHYTILKNRIRSNIIPLGLLRFGGYTERALLFKVLADRVGLLCELHHNNAISWVQVPMICTADEEMYFPNDPIDESTTMTIKYYVVDLMYKIGNFVPVENWDAVAYTKGQSTTSIYDSEMDDFLQRNSDVNFEPSTFSIFLEEPASRTVDAFKFNEDISKFA